MNILVIGNGFDIAHGLPTHYSDFLDFIKHWNVKDRFSVSDSNDDLIYVNEFEELIKRNALIDYFLKIYEKECRNGKDKWVDFEREIAKVVQNLCAWKHMILSGARDVRKSINYKERVDFFIEYYNLFKEGRRIDLYDSSWIDNLASLLLTSLNGLIRALEIYLTLFLPKNNVSLINQINELPVNCLLSFNYTDTFNIYHKRVTDSCFIHGKASLHRSMDDCNIVLGIDEFLPEGDRDDKNDFVWFKKFYQRIYKQTESNYLDWIDQSVPTLGENDIYFWGHSLDATDKDVISKLILARNSRTHIIYHSKKALSAMIENLVKVIGEDNLIKKTGGCDRTIEFIPIIHS